MRCQRRSSSASTRPSSPRTTANSSLSAVDGSGTGTGALVLDALVHDERGVATVVEDHVGTDRLPVGPPGHDSARSVHHQYSSSVSPFHANTGMPAAAIAAAAWSWVEKMLHDAQRTSAPSATSVSISTAVWIVMWSEPVMRAPASGLRRGVALAQRHEAGHLVLGELDLLATEVGEGEVGDLEVDEVGRGGRDRSWSSSGDSFMDVGRTCASDWLWESARITG